MSYTGELGWELHTPAGDLAQLYDRVRSAGEALGIRDFGLYAMDSLRLEKCYRSWKAELTRERTPIEASLERFLRMSKPGGFIGQQALEEQRSRGPRERLVPLIVAAEDADASPGAVLFERERNVGLVTSGGYGHRIGQSIALAYVTAELTSPGQVLEVEILGERRRAVVSREPLYDPTRSRIRA
jgi:dimethylglycine dehydrogenase